MPLFMSTSCLLNTTAIVTVYTQAPQHHHSQMMAGYQGGVPVQLFWTPQSLQSAKQWESDHGTKYGVLVLKYIQSWIWPLCVAIASCQSVILALPAAANNSDTLWMGWSMSGAASVLAGSSSLTWLIELLAILLLWTCSELHQVFKRYILFCSMMDSKSTDLTCFFLEPQTQQS